MIITETRAINRTLAGLKEKIPNILHQGGSSSGKTWGILYALLSYLLYYRQSEKLLCSVVAETFPHLKKGSMKDFGEILEETNLINAVKYNKTDSKFTLPTGSVFEFFSSDIPSKVRGPRRDILFINEANSITWEVFMQLNMRTHETAILDWNPSGEFWLHDTFLPTLKADEYIFTRTTYHDNPAIGEKTIKEIERLKDIDPQLYRIYAEGKTGQVQGLIYTNVAYIDAMPQYLKKEGYGLDFGFTNDPTSLVHCGELHGETFADELIHETGLTNDDICDRLEALKIDRKAEIWADSAEPKSIEEIKRRGWNIRPVTKGADSVNFGIDLLKQYRQNWTHSSTNAKKELKKYKWKVDRDGNVLNVPIDAFNHCFIGATKIKMHDGEKQIFEVVCGDLVLTSQGFRKVIKKWNNGCKKVFEYRIVSNKKTLSLTCTNNHLIKTSQGWKRIDKIEKGDLICLAKHSEERNTIYIQVKNISLRAAIGFMLLFGNIIMARFQKVFMSITKMKTIPIIMSKTLNCFQYLTICQCTAKNVLLQILTFTKYSKKKESRLLKIGIKAKKVKIGIQNMQEKLDLENVTMEQSNALFVKRILKAGQQLKDFAQMLAKQSIEELQGLIMKKEFVPNANNHSVFQNTQFNPYAHWHVVESIEVMSESNQEVFDLTVEHEHEFFANSILVHNCMDAKRYWAMMNLKTESKRGVRIRDFSQYRQ